MNIGEIEISDKWWENLKVFVMPERDGKCELAFMMNYPPEYVRRYKKPSQDMIDLLARGERVMNEIIGFDIPDHPKHEPKWLSKGDVPFDLEENQVELLKRWQDTIVIKYKDYGLYDFQQDKCSGRIAVSSNLQKEKLYLCDPNQIRSLKLFRTRRYSNNDIIFSKHATAPVIPDLLKLIQNDNEEK